MIARLLCECHGEPMYWNNDARTKLGGYWRCAVKKRAEARARYWIDPERERARGGCLRAHPARLRAEDPPERPLLLPRGLMAC
jgi:hypothetical protein